MKKSLFIMLIGQQLFSQSSVLTDVGMKEKRSSGEIILILVLFVIAAIVFIAKSDKK